MKKIMLVLIIVSIQVVTFSQPPTPPSDVDYYTWYAGICMALFSAGFGTKWLLLAFKNKRLADKEKAKGK